MASSVQIELKGIDNASSAVKSVQDSIGGLHHAAASASASVQASLGGIGAKAVALGGILANAATAGVNALTSAFGALKDGMIGGNAQFETFSTQFGVLLAPVENGVRNMTKGVELAKERMAELAQFGANTPFELPEVVRADKILQAFGLHAQETAQRFGMSGSQIRTIAGDVAAGTGAKFEEIANYLGKFSSGATGEAIARMQELGITTRAELTQMGLSFSKSGELTSPLDKSMGILLQAMKAKFGGMMDAQSATFDGMKSNFQDWVGQAMRVMGAPIFDALKGQLSGLLQLLGSPTVQNALVGIGQALGNMATSGISALQNLASSVTPFVSAIQGVFNIVQNQGGFMGNMDAWASGLDAAFGSDTTNKIIGFATSLSSLMQGNVGGGVSGILQSLGLGPETAGQVGSAIDGVVSAVQGAASRIQTAIQTFKNGLYFGGGTAVSNFLISLGLDSGVAASVGSAVDNVIGVVQGAAGRIQTAIQTFKNGLYFGGGTAVSNFLISLGVDSGTAASIGTGVDTIISSIQGAIGRVQTAITTFRNGLYFGGGTAVSNFLISLGVDSGTAASIGTGVDGIIANIQGAMGRVQTAMQSLQSGFAAGTPGAGVAGFLSALGLDDQLAGSIGAKVAEINTAIQTAKSNLGTAIQSFMAGWQQGSPGAAVAGFLSAMGVSDDIAGKIGSVVGQISQAIQTAKSTLQTVMQGFQSGGVAGGATALLQSLGLDTSIVGQAQTVFENIKGSIQTGIQKVKDAIATAMSGGSLSNILVALGVDPTIASQAQTAFETIRGAIQTGIQKVKDAIATAMSGGGLSGVLSALGLDPSIASQAQTVFNTVVSAVQSGVQRIKDAIVAVASGQGASGVLRALGLSDETVGQIRSVLDRIGAVVGVLAQNFQSGFQRAAAALLPIQGPLKELATLVGGLVVGAFLGLVGFVAGAIPGIANVIAGVVKTVNGVLQFMAEFIKGVISIVANLIQGNWAGAWQAAVTMVQNMNTRAQEIMNGLKQAALGIFQTLVGGVISAFQTLYTAVTGEKLPNLINEAKAKFEELKTAAVAKFTELKDSAITKVTELKDQVVAGFIELKDSAVTKVQDLVNGGLDVLKGAVSSWADAGRGLVDAMADGIKAAAGKVIDSVRNMVQKARDLLPGSDAKEGPLSDLTASGAALGSTFASGMMSTLPGIVAGVRSVMERVGQVLKGVGDFISTSDWEDLAGPVKLMADTLQAIAEIGKTVASEGMASNWAAAQTQVNGFIASARAILTGLSSTLKGVGDFVSTSDWEDFTAPLKMLADSLSSIGQISSLFADQKSIPSLTGLAAPIRQLAVEARAILVDLDSAIQPISMGLPDKLKTLGDAAAGAKSIAENALGLVRALQAALAVDWSSINFSAAGQMMHDLGIMVVYFASKSQEAGAAIQRVDTTGLGPLKAAAENLIGIAEGARLIVVKLVDALTVRWGDINWPAAGVMMHDLAQMVVYFTQKALEASVVLANVDTSGLGPLKANADSLLGIADGARAVVTKLVDALTVNWAGINWPAAGQMMHDLAQMAVYFVTKASEAAVAILVIDTSGLGPLSTALTTVLSIVQTTRDAWDALADALTFDWNSTPFDLMLVGLSSLTVKAGQLVAVAARAALGILGIDTSGLAPLNTAMGALDSIVKATTSIWAGLLAAMQFDWSTAPFDRMLVVMDSLTVKAALLVAAASRAALAVVGIDTSGLAPLNTALESLSGVVTRTVDLFGVLAGKDFPDLSNSAFAIISARLDQLIRDALSLANRAAAAITATLTVSPIMADLGRALGDILSVAKNALDIVGQLGGDKFPPLTGGALTIILTRLEDVLRAGKAINDKALAVAAGWQASVNPVMATVGTILSSGLELVSKTLDIVGQLGGDKFPPLTGDALTRILARLEDTLTAGRAIGVVASRVASTWQATVNPVMAVVGTILAAGLEIVSKTMDIVGQLAGDKFPALTGDALARILVRLEDTLTAGRAISVIGARIASQWQATTNPVMTVVGGILSSGLEIVSKTLDIVGQLAGDKFPALTNDALGRILVRLEDTLNAGRAISVVAARIASQWQATTNPVMAVVGGILNSGLDIISKTLDIVGQLGGEKFPALTGAALAGILTRLEDTLAAGKAISDKASQIAAGWQATVNPAMAAVGRILSDGLEVLGKTLDISALLSGDKFPGFTAADQALLLTLLATVLSVGMALGDEANRIIGDWQTVVKPALTNLGKTLKSALDGAEAVLDINSLLGGKTAPTFDLSVLMTRLALVLAAGMALGDKANEVIGSWTIIVKPALDNLGKTLKSSLDVATSVLDFSDLQSKLLSFRGFDMRLLGLKIDLLISSAIAVAQEFGTKAANAQIKEEWQKAGAALKGLFGDAASVIKDALDMGARLLDPETQIPSIGQIQAKLDALFNLITNVATQYAAKASSLASQGIDTKAAGELAGQIKAIFDSLSTVAKTVQDFTGIAIGSSGFNNIQALLDNLFGLFDNVSGQADTVNAVTAAITSLLGGIQALAAESGFSAGQSWASQFAAGIAAAASGVIATAGGAAATIGAGALRGEGERSLPPGFAGTGGGSGTTNVYNAPLSSTTNNISVNLSTAIGLDSSLTMLTNMARG